MLYDNYSCNLKKQKETHLKNNNLHNANYYLNNLIIALKSVLYKRVCQIFSEIILGTILVCGTVSQWIIAVQFQKKFRKEYHLQRLGISTVLFNFNTPNGLSSRRFDFSPNPLVLLSLAAIPL